MTNYQKIQIKHYYIGRKWEKHKNKKVKDCRKVRRKFRSRLQNFIGVAKIRNPCEIGKVAIASSVGSAFTFFWLGCSELQLDSSCL